MAGWRGSILVVLVVSCLQGRAYTVSPQLGRFRRGASMATTKQPFHKMQEPSGEADWAALNPPDDLVAALNKKNAAAPASKLGPKIGIVLFSAIGLAFQIVLIKTLMKYPIWPFQPDSAA